MGGGVHINLSGLKQGLTGPDFEVQLGRYLTARLAFTQIEPFIAARHGSSLLNVDDLLRGVDAYVPVLHLHGKAGWYRRREDQTPYAVDTTTHNTGFGTPLVMLPDPGQEYGEEIINRIWTQFQSALERARMVLVVGHSLHDKLLVQALRDSVTPPHRLGIALYADAPAGAVLRYRDHDETAAIIDEALPNAKKISMRFGDAETQNSAGLLDWL